MSTPIRLIQRLGASTAAFLGRLRRDQRGAIAVQFAILAIPLSIMVFALVDLGRIGLQRRQMQDALDAATLMAARSTATTDADLDKIGDAAFVAEIAGLGLGIDGSNSTFKAGADNHILGSAVATLKPIIANLWTSKDFTVTATADVVRSSKNLEVAVVLDITGSMSGSRITDLKSGASDLVDIVVKDVQSPYYSKVAIVPYSMGVNVGDYADAVRSPITARSVTGVTQADPAVVTSNKHGFVEGDIVSFSGVNGMTWLNGRSFEVTNVKTNRFSLKDADTRYKTAYSSGGTATCEQSTTPGCRNYTFTNAEGNSRTRELSTCVTERIGSEAYTDAAPSTAWLGRNYPSDGNECPSSEIVPLSSDRTALKAKINALTIGGSTAGQIGFAWGWYMIAPNFGYLWPNTVQRPAAYKAKDLMKVVVLMTDGDFNTPYCNGVIAKDAGSGSGNNSDHINCNATNGDPFAQTKKMCDAMKNSAYDITIYTVGFTVTSTAAKDVLTYCATSSDYAYFPTTGSDLKSSFKAIAVGISNLRIAK